MKRYRLGKIVQKMMIDRKCVIVVCAGNDVNQCVDFVALHATSLSAPNFVFVSIIYRDLLEQSEF